MPELRREEQPLESTSLKQADLQALGDYLLPSSLRSYIHTALQHFAWFSLFLLCAAESEELRGVLGDTRLQSLIQSIDSDPDREQVAPHLCSQFWSGLVLSEF